MKRFIASILLVALVMTTTGCFHNQVIVESNYDSSQPAPDYRNAWQAYAIMGLIPLGNNPIDLAQVCPQGAGVVQTKQTFVNGLVNVLIGVFVSFQDVSATCARAPGASLTGPTVASN